MIIDEWQMAIFLDKFSKQESGKWNQHNVLFEILAFKKYLLQQRSWEDACVDLNEAIFIVLNKFLSTFRNFYFSLIKVIQMFECL